MSIVEDIRKQDKHKGHLGQLGGCPLCEYKQSEVDTVEDPISEPEADPIKGRLDKLFNK